MDLDENEIYKFLGVEQADGIKTRNVFERVKNEVNPPMTKGGWMPPTPPPPNRFFQLFSEMGRALFAN